MVHGGRRLDEAQRDDESAERQNERGQQYTQQLTNLHERELGGFDRLSGFTVRQIAGDIFDNLTHTPLHPFRPLYGLGGAASRWLLVSGAYDPLGDPRWGRDTHRANLSGVERATGTSCRPRDHVRVLRVCGKLSTADHGISVFVSPTLHEGGRAPQREEKVW